MPVEELYGDEYGYESHLNSQMRHHLISAAKNLETQFQPTRGDSVLDIASNDGTLLSGYSGSDFCKFGVDPLARKLSDKYPINSIKIPQFFSAESVRDYTNNEFKIITSFSVFYDLDKPIEFVHSVEEILAKDGVWVLEQSYFFGMMETLSFDTICHEHLLYLRLIDIEKILSETSLEVFDVQLNEANGGSFRVFVKRKTLSLPISPFVDWLRKKELAWESDPSFSADTFARRVKVFKEEIRDLLSRFKHQGKTIIGFGASTKGNALLQYCGLTNEFIEFIVEINERKFGKVTPGTEIPIQSEEYFKEVFRDREDAVGFILPWHLADSVIERNVLTASSLNPREFVLPLPRYPRVLNFPK